MGDEIKKAYQEKTEAQLREWGNKIEGLKDKAAAGGADAKIKVLEKIEGLKKKMKEGSDNLDQIKKANESDWEKLKTKMEGIGEGIKKAIDDIMSE